MKIHKQAVLLESYANGYLEILSFYDTKTKTFGVDVFLEEKLIDTTHGLKAEPLREHLVSIGYSFLVQKKI